MESTESRPSSSPSSYSEDGQHELEVGDVKSNVLARNSACHQCRKRKMKCDGVRPVCANCVKPRARLAPGQPPPICSWDDPHKVTRRKETKDSSEVAGKKAKLHQLEARVAAFEKMLENQHENEGRRSSRANDLYPVWNPIGPNSSLGASPVAPSVTHAAGSGIGSLEGSASGGYELAWPDWPKDLPCFEVVEHCVSVFFERIPLLPAMMHRGRFMANLHLPPSHADFPTKALLHAILAIAAVHIPESSLTCKEYFPTGTPRSFTTHPEEDFELGSTMMHTFQLFVRGLDSGAYKPRTTALGRFQMWHRRKTFSSLQRQFEYGESILQALQAQIIVTSVDQYNAWWIDTWMESAGCMRMVIPMGINESPNIQGEPLKRWEHVVMFPPRDAMDQAERDRTFWVAWSLERTTNHTTGWSECLPSEEITVELPVTQVLFDRAGGGLTGVQTLQSADFYSRHPPEHCDGIGLYMKSIQLFSEVQRFFRVYCRGSHSIKKYLNDPNLRILLSNTNSLRLSTPAHLRRPTQALAGPNGSKKMDTVMLAAVMLANTAVLVLGEPLITKEHWQTELAKLALSSIRANLSLLYDINATSYDLTLLPHTCATCWTLSCRALCRFIAAATQSGDEVSALICRSECEVFRLALLRYGERWPMADRVLKMIDAVLEKQGLSPDANVADGYDCKRETIFDPEFEGTVRSTSRFKSFTNANSSSVASTPASSVPSLGNRDAGSGYTSNMSPLRTPDIRLGPGSGSALPVVTRESTLEGYVIEGRGPPQPNAPQPPAPPASEAPVPWFGDNMVPPPDIPDHTVNPGIPLDFAQMPLPNGLPFVQPSDIPGALQDYTMNGPAQQAVSQDFGVNLADWFDIQNFAFDMNSISQTAQNVNPDWTFDGHDMGMKLF